MRRGGERDAEVRLCADAPHRRPTAGCRRCRSSGSRRRRAAHAISAPSGISTAARTPRRPTRATRLRQLVAASLYRRHRPRTFADVVGQEHVVRTLQQRDRAGPRAPRVSVRRLARHRQDVDGQDPRGFAELPGDRRRHRPDGPITPCGDVRVVQVDRRGLLARRRRDGRRVQQLRRRHPRPARARRLRAGGRRATRSTSSTRRTCSRRRRGTRSSRRSRSRRRTRSSCSPRPRPTRSCRRSSTAATASTSAARASSRSPRCCAAWPTRSRSRSPTRRVALVARSATGSFRDALGTLEQLLAYSGAEIVLEDVLAVLGAADADLLFGALDAVAAGDARARAARRRPAGRLRSRPRPLLRRPRGPRPRRCWSPRCSARSRPSCASPRAGRAPGRAGPPRRRRRDRPAAGADRGRAARDEGRRRRRAPSSSWRS